MSGLRVDRFLTIRTVHQWKLISPAGSKLVSLRWEQAEYCEGIHGPGQKSKEMHTRNVLHIQGPHGFTQGEGAMHLLAHSALLRAPLGWCRAP